jgi:hypothetical protein
LELAQPGLDDRRLDAPQLTVAEVAGGVEAEPKLGGSLELSSKVWAASQRSASSAKVTLPASGLT